MRTIQDAGPTEVEAIKRRTIKTLAMGEIDRSDCDYITNHLDAVLKRLASMNKTGELDAVHHS